MEERGTIIRVSGQTATIRAERSSACESCSSKKSCSSGAADPTGMLIEADNAAGAKAGDRVVFAVSASSVIKAGALLYLFPIVSFIAGVVIGQAVAAPALPGYNPDLVAGLLGLACLVAAFLALKAYNSVALKGKAMRPRVIRVE